MNFHSAHVSNNKYGYILYRLGETEVDPTSGQREGEQSQECGSYSL